ncbi:DUF927 domain-containing protein [Cupriavidus agavae]|uniref:Uncharacterized protein DUF927 n=1 Tax=Cupriavidus agavae TaxID=1001822 RepID=A0A4Q7RYU3_9BURK|nr:DUF927 domain-containing protein [Cupriavidus agavae]RZT38388.1 uncharacterized protein DUF927 [Cupriavidus agavae]
MKSQPFRFISKTSIAGAFAKQLAHGGCTVLSDAGEDISASVHYEDDYEQTTIDLPSSNLVLRIPRTCKHQEALAQRFNANGPIFRAASDVYVPLLPGKVKCAELLKVYRHGLASVGVELQNSEAFSKTICAGTWHAQTRGESSGILTLRKALELVDSADIGLRSQLFMVAQLDQYAHELDGVYYIQEDKPRQRVGPPVVVLAMQRNDEDQSCYLKLGVIVETATEERLEILMIDNATAQTPADLKKYIITRIPTAVNQVKFGKFMHELLSHAFPRLPLKRGISREGFVSGPDGKLIGCVLGRTLVSAAGAKTDDLVVSVESPLLSLKGHLQGWNDEVLRHAARSPLMLGALQLALAGVLLPRMPNVTGGMFTFFGGAGRGKTLLLSVLASLFGNPAGPSRASTDTSPKLITTFNATMMAIQSMSQRATIAPVIVDELGSNNFSALDQFVYLIGNGAARPRATNTGGLIAQTPRPIFLFSSGECASVELVGRNAKQGVMDRTVDIYVGGATTAFPDGLQAEADDGASLLEPSSIRALAAGLGKHYGSVAPAFATAVMQELSKEGLDAELLEIRKTLTDQVFHVPSDGALRVFDRFALGLLAGRIALRNGVFDATIVDEDALTEGLLECMLVWANLRWSHLVALRSALPAHGEFAENDVEMKLHRDMYAAWPTVMIEKEAFEQLVAPLDATVVSKRLRDEGLLHRNDVGRNTVGKNPPYYHLRTHWLNDLGVRWDAKNGAFI